MLYGLPRASDFLQIGQNGQIEAIEPRSDVGGRDLPGARFLGLPGQNAGEGFGSPIANSNDGPVTLGDPDSGVGECRPEGWPAVRGLPGRQDLGVH